jgi:hypothetical protein
MTTPRSLRCWAYRMHGSNDKYWKGLDKTYKKMPPGGIRHKLENTEMYFGEVVYKEVKWNNLAQKRALSPNFVITAANLHDS